MAQNYRILLVGDAGVGKSCFLQRHRTNQFQNTYNATSGVNIQPLVFHTNHGPIEFDVWDCAGQEKFVMMNKHCDGADGLICMYDLTNERSHKNVTFWTEKIKSFVPNIPTVVCGNKVDDINWNIDKKSLSFKTMKTFLISAKTNYNLDKPFLDLARKLTGFIDLKFVHIEDMAPVNNKSTPPTTVHWVNIPSGGVMKITYEFYADRNEINNDESVMK